MFTPHLDLNPLLRGWSILSHSVDHTGGEIDLLLVENEELAEEISRSSGECPAYNARLLHVSEHYHWELEFSNLRRPYHRFCNLGNEQFVLLSYERLKQPNVFLFDRNGNLLASFWVGDYVAHLQADSAGRIWVSYFDQAFGRDYSQKGLSCYDCHGQAVAPWWDCPMMDCYAMNVSKDAVWHCGFNDFPIERVGFDGSQRSWDNQVRGASAIVGWGQRAALYGGYGDRSQHLTTLALRDDKAVVQQDRVASLPGDDPRVLGRGPYFHTLHKGTWYRLDPGLRD